MSLLLLLLKSFGVVGGGGGVLNLVNCAWCSFRLKNETEEKKK